MRGDAGVTTDAGADGETADAIDPDGDDRVSFSIDEPAIAADVLSRPFFHGRADVLTRARFDEDDGRALATIAADKRDDAGQMLSSGQVEALRESDDWELDYITTTFDGAPKVKIREVLDE